MRHRAKTTILARSAFHTTGVAEAPTGRVGRGEQGERPLANSAQRGGPHINFGPGSALNLAQNRDFQTADRRRHGSSYIQRTIPVNITPAAVYQNQHA